ncbi:MAG: NAD(P)/FAD-dependent oxidoreductase [Luminiphilus sp.]|jgi:phytoene dehydrogenase-like protein|nr:NAD(P)/FAD-dependent oxidoreductase [Luminiphilus sp.]
MSHYDAIVIGAGHNGLTTANYLAKGGMNVCVLEQRPVVGGAAVTEEFCPGYRNSTFSYVVSLLRPEVIRDLQLADYGYEAITLENALYIDSTGDHLLLTADEQFNRSQFEKFSRTDFQAYEAFEHSVDEIGQLLAKQWLSEPPKLGEQGVGDLLAMLKMGVDVFRLDSEARWRLMQFFIGAPETIIDRWFESDKVKSMIAAHIMPANYAPLSQPGASLAMLHHAVGEVNGRAGAWGIVRGGMGGITQAMMRSALARGVAVRTDAAVHRIDVSNGRVTGVTLASGEALTAPVVAANTDPKRTFFTLLGEEHLPEDFSRDLKSFRQESASLRMNLALSDLPEFAALPGAEGPHHRASITMIESADHLNAAFHSAKRGEPADPPIIEAIIPSALDTTLTDTPGHHVMSLLCKYMPYDLNGGRSWDDEKDRVVEHIFRYVEHFIPRLREITVGYQCLTPLDLETMLGMTRGDICHGRLEPDQLFNMRPHPNAAQYATPVKGLYLCGSGAHPGGGVTGAPGHNAARRILKDA